MMLRVPRLPLWLMSLLVSLIHRNGALHALVGIKIRGQRCAIRENASIKRKAQALSGLQRGRLRKGGSCAGVYGIPQGTLPQAPCQQRLAECQTRDQAPLQGCAIFPLEGIDAALVASESHGGRGAVVLAARILRGFGRCGLRRGTRQAGPGT